MTRERERARARTRERTRTRKKEREKERKRKPAKDGVLDAHCSCATCFLSPSPPPLSVHCIDIGAKSCSTSDTFLSLAKLEQLQRWASFDANVCKLKLGEMSKCVEVFNLFVLQGSAHSIVDFIFSQKCKEVDVTIMLGTPRAGRIKIKDRGSGG